MADETNSPKPRRDIVSEVPRPIPANTIVSESPGHGESPDGGARVPDAVDPASKVAEEAAKVAAAQRQAGDEAEALKRAGASLMSGFNQLASNPAVGALIHAVIQSIGASDELTKARSEAELRANEANLLRQHELAKLKIENDHSERMGQLGLARTFVWISVVGGLLFLGGVATAIKLGALSMAEAAAFGSAFVAFVLATAKVNQPKA